MEWFGAVAMIFSLVFFTLYMTQLTQLKRTVKRLQKKIKGDDGMSKLIQALIGKDCVLKLQEVSSFSGSTELTCHVLDADDEWIKLRYTDKKKGEKTGILRIDAVESVELLSGEAGNP